MILASGCATAQTDISFKSTEVAPGRYMLEGVGGFTGGNLGLLTGDDGNILIDNGVIPLVDKTMAAVGKASGGAPDFVINTHAHGDHIGGNKAASEAGATIIAHDKLRHRLVEEGISGPSGQVEASDHWLPEITFDSSLSLHLNGHHVHVFHVSNAHTDGDSVVYFPDANTIHAGDVFFNGLFPYIDIDSGGSVDGYLAAQHKILMMAGDDTTIIAGHGPLATKDDLQAAHNMLSDSRDRIRAMVKAGKSEDDIVEANPLADYHDGWNWGFITTERMTRQLIRDAGN
ncbi:MAG: MBL fold metallo-hydrolase [Gammaproteobacteria bacterium]|nr:MBL fold metallo-hydrolase [Gammaproteobacteria bacterium]